MVDVPLGESDNRSSIWRRWIVFGHYLGRCECTKWGFWWEQKSIVQVCSSQYGQRKMDVYVGEVELTTNVLRVSLDTNKVKHIKRALESGRLVRI